jgi:hypothetical protein
MMTTPALANPFAVLLVQFVTASGGIADVSRRVDCFVPHKYLFQLYPALFNFHPEPGS